MNFVHGVFYIAILSNMAQRQRLRYRVARYVIVKNRRAHFRMAGYAIQCARRFFYSYLKETKKINSQFLNEVWNIQWKHNLASIVRINWNLAFCMQFAHA